ncbi:MAG: biopolymer transporter ExbD [Candidatus Omnitrophota bacterium]
MRFKQKVQFVKGQLDIAPLIDCIFLLLIFFLLTSNFIFQPGIKVSLPKAVTSEVIQENTLIITITSDNRFYLNELPITFVELKNKLGRSASKDNIVLIKADRDVSLGKVVSVWDFCRDIGVTHINIATNQEMK